MEPVKTALIYKLQLGKFRIAEIKQSGDYWIITIEFPSAVYAHSKLPFKPKLNVGDTIKLYTEVCPDAQPSQPPIQ